MGILVDATSRVVVQGITGNDGSFHTGLMLDFGTSVVAGVTPGKGGQTFEHGGQRITRRHAQREQSQQNAEAIRNARTSWRA